jgi:type II secretion system protein J
MEQSQRAIRYPANAGAGMRFDAAFTLLELLLSIAIFAVVLAAINGVLYGALRLRNSTTQMIEEALPVQRAVEMIRRDLSGIVVPGTNMAGPMLSDLDTTQPMLGTPASPTFYTTTGRITETLPWAELQKVTYYLKPPTNRYASAGFDLIRTVTRNLLPSNQQLPDENDWLMTGVERLDFSYYDGTQWQNTWNSTNQTVPLPRAIKLEMLLAQPLAVRNRSLAGMPTRIQVVAPVLVAGITNQTGGAQ